MCNSDNLRRGSGSSSPNGSSSSSVNISPISYSEYSMTGSANEESENEISNDQGQFYDVKLLSILFDYNY